MQSATGQYGTQAGEPAQPVQHSVMTASSFGFFFRGVRIPSDFGSLLTTVAVMFELCHIKRWVRPESTAVRFSADPRLRTKMPSIEIQERQSQGFESEKRVISGHGDNGY